MHIDWNVVTTLAAKGWQMTLTALWESWQMCLLGLSMASNYLDEMIFAFSYNTPQLDYDRETGECNVMKLEYRIGGQRYCIFRRAETPIPRVQRILGASLTYDPQHTTALDATPVGSLVLDVKHALQEASGPFQDFHGQKLKVIDIVKYLVPAEQREGISNSDWMRHGQLRVTLLTDQADKDKPAEPKTPLQSKWVTKTFSMGDVIDWSTGAVAPTPNEAKKED